MPEDDQSATPERTILPDLTSLRNQISALETHSTGLFAENRNLRATIAELEEKVAARDKEIERLNAEAETGATATSDQLYCDSSYSKYNLLWAPQPSPNPWLTQPAPDAEDFRRETLHRQQEAMERVCAVQAAAVERHRNEQLMAMQQDLHGRMLQSRAEQQPVDAYRYIPWEAGADSSNFWGVLREDGSVSVEATNENGGDNAPSDNAGG